VEEKQTAISSFACDGIGLSTVFRIN
jgi:MFS family permease